MYEIGVVDWSFRFLGSDALTHLFFILRLATCRNLCFIFILFLIIVQRVDLLRVSSVTLVKGQKAYRIFLLWRQDHGQ